MLKYFLLFTFYILLLSSFSQNASDKKTCKDCHNTLIEQKINHPPMDDCNNCHKTNGQEHPLANTKGFTLTQKVPDICYSCHDPLNKKKNIHPPVESGECLDCHTPHNSANKSLLINFPTSKICETCHDLKLSEIKVTHKPVAEGNCQGCHDPHQSDIPKLLKAEKMQLCFICHSKQKDAQNLKNVHPPFQDDCLACHIAHGSKEPHLLTSGIPELCYGCHDDLKETFEKSPVIHGPLKDAKACINCHSPHASNEKKFLLSEEKDLCISCHNKAITTENRNISNIKQALKNKYVHGAIESDGCTACHNPHVSKIPNLLIASFPSDKYIYNDFKNNIQQNSKDSILKSDYALCFKCHDAQLLLTPETKTATGFRNGEKNLHYLHVNRKKGRNCDICHNMHGSPNEHLINETVQFEKWVMKLNYKSLENGGSCLPGCHAEKKYTR